MVQVTPWPTGLDSFSALRVMQHVFDLAKTGKIVFASIHQPRMEIFTRMTNVILLSEGRQIYFGQPESATAWFGQLGYTYCAGRVSVSDWLLDTVSVGFDRTTLDECLQVRHWVSVGGRASGVFVIADSI